MLFIFCELENKQSIPLNQLRSEIHDEPFTATELENYRCTIFKIKDALLQEELCIRCEPMQKKQIQELVKRQSSDKKKL